MTLLVKMETRTDPDGFSYETVMHLVDGGIAWSAKDHEAGDTHMTVDIDPASEAAAQVLVDANPSDITDIS